MHPEKPVIAVTMGDPAGVGPEIVARALSKPEIHQVCTPFVVGDIALLEKALETVADVECRCQFNELSSVEELEPSTGTLQVLNTGCIDLKKYRPGTVLPEYGRAAGECIAKAIELAMAGKAHAVVTAPIQKESFKAAGYPYPGHTEMFGALTGTKNYALMLAVDDFRVVHVTLHMPLGEAVKQIKKERVLDTIRVAHAGCRSLGIERPRIGVAGLNPHAGESGLFGAEDRDEIHPAVEAACAEGIEAEGPFSSDTVFALLRGGKFDIVVCMYHDQGGIPMKLLSFDWDARQNRWSRIRGVNVTLGLPIIRTSVAHGTGFEIAGRGIADSTSLEEAVHVAARMAAIKFAARIPERP